jgi:hypothetical protein
MHYSTLPCCFFCCNRPSDQSVVEKSNATDFHGVITSQPQSKPGKDVLNAQAQRPFQAPYPNDACVGKGDGKGYEGDDAFFSIG